MSPLAFLLACNISKDDYVWEYDEACQPLDLETADAVPKDTGDPDWFYQYSCVESAMDPFTREDGLVDSIKVNGLTDGADLSTFPDTRNVRVAWYTYLEYFGYSESVLATGTDGEWTAAYDADALRVEDGDGIDCESDSLHPSNCGGYYHVRIEESADSALCDYLPAEVCVRYKEKVAVDEDEDSVDCTPGTGSFSLAGYRWYDEDEDGVGALVLGGLQLTGAATMTNSATVTQIKVVEDGVYDLRLINNDALFSIDDNDQLEDSASVSQLVIGTKNFTAGQVRGNPIFVMTGVSATDTVQLKVDMTWQCRTSGWTSLSLAQGYQKRLADLGCGTLKQKITLRPGGDWISLELYGQPLAPKWSALGAPVAGKRSFSFGTSAGLSVQGRLGAHDQTSATIYLDSLKWKGANKCTAGTYTFQAE